MKITSPGGKNLNLYFNCKNHKVKIHRDHDLHRPANRRRLSIIISPQLVGVTAPYILQVTYVA